MIINPLCTHAAARSKIRSGKFLATDEEIAVFRSEDATILKAKKLA
jgi:hypothetical protein